MLLPEACFLENGCENSLGAVKSAIETIEEPFQPERNVEISPLRSLQDIVVLFLLLLDLRRHAVETLRAFLRPCELHVGNRSGNAAIAIIERMDGHEP